MSDISYVAIAIIADSSLGLTSQWINVLISYITPLLGRLHEKRAGSQFLIGFVTYGTADVYPTPILAKRYFNQPQLVIREIKDEFSKLGLGKTGFGGKTGMAALEGYAAALEMFDLFQQSLQVKPTEKPSPERIPQHTFHIFHVAMGQPDTARHPVWNQSSELDTLSWMNLGDEIKKRNINLNMILLKHIPQLSELHASTITDPHPTWFSVISGHTVLLSSQQGWALPPTEIKEEVPTPDNTEDLKSAPNPSVVKSNASSIPAAGQTSASTATAPAPTRPTIPLHLISEEQFNAISTQCKNLEASIKRDVVTIKAAMQAGRVDEANTLKKTLQKSLGDYTKLQSFLQAIQQQRSQTMHTAQKSNPAANGGPDQLIPAGSSNEQAGQIQPALTDPIAQSVPPLVPQAPIPPAQSINQTANQRLAQLVLARQAQQTQNAFGNSQIMNLNTSNTMVPKPSIGLPPNIPPSVAAQMQKLVGREGIQGQNLLPAPIITQGQTTQPPHTASAIQVQNVNAAQNSQTNSRQWIGSLTWTGKDPTGLTIHIDVQVAILAQPDVSIRPEVWPRVLNLVPSSEKAVSMQDLKIWISQYKPMLCQLKPLPSSIDPQVNFARFQALGNLLFEKNLYAVASWPLPSTGELRPTALIFPVGSKENMAVAAFPETGIPEFPKTANRNPTLTQPISMNTDNMTPQQREHIANFIALQRTRQQQLLQAQSAGLLTPQNSNSSLEQAAMRPNTWPMAQNNNINLNLAPSSSPTLPLSIGMSNNNAFNPSVFNPTPTPAPNMQSSPSVPAGANSGLNQLIRLAHMRRQAAMGAAPGLSNTGALAGLTPDMFQALLQRGVLGGGINMNMNTNPTQ